MSTVVFHKMSGGGNDFILFDNRDGQFGEDVSVMVKQLCTRGFSIGADGVIFIENSKRADFKMTYYNSNGERAGFCGNGARCAARFAFMNVIASRQMKMESDIGTLKAEIIERSVRLEIPYPEVIDNNVSFEIEGKRISACYVESGVPHIVMFVKRIWDFDITPFSQKVRYHNDFRNKGGVNVNYVERKGKCHLDIRTYERGVEGETLSCGSGCIAAALAAGSHYPMNSPVALTTKGGTEFIVEFSSSDPKVTLTGDARVIYKGEYWKEALNGFSLETDNRNR